MLQQQYALTAYSSAIQTLPSVNVIVLLYDRILVCLRNASEAGERKDFGEEFNQVLRATEVLRGLLAALDIAKGGELGRKLRDVYEINMHAMMQHVNTEDAPDRLRHIAGGLRELRNAWEEIAKAEQTRGNYTNGV